MSKAEYWQRGESIDYKNTGSSAIEANSVIVLGKRVGVAGMTIQPGETGSLHVKGVFRFEKDDNNCIRKYCGRIRNRSGKGSRNISARQYQRMRELIALRPVLYHAHQYSTGESLPVNDQEMTELWLKAGTAMWKEDEPEPQAAQAIPVTAVAGMPGMSDAGTDGLIGRIPETPERKTAPAKKPTRTTTRKKKA